MIIILFCSEMLLQHFNIFFSGVLQQSCKCLVKGCAGTQKSPVLEEQSESNMASFPGREHDPVLKSESCGLDQLSPQLFLTGWAGCL